MNEKVKENIERLGEICAAQSMIRIGKELQDEMEAIVNYLRVVDVIEMDSDGRGFSFTTNEYRDLFIECRDNF